MFSEDAEMEHYPNTGSKESEINLRPCIQTGKLIKAEVTSECFQSLKASRLSNNFFMVVFLRKRYSGKTFMF